MTWDDQRAHRATHSAHRVALLLRTIASTGEKGCRLRHMLDMIDASRLAD